MEYNKILKNIDHFKKEKYQLNTPKIIKWYICRDREMKITFKNSSIFNENK